MFKKRFLTACFILLQVHAVTLEEQEHIEFYYGTIPTIGKLPGVRSDYNSNDFMAQLSDVNKDLALLMEMRSFQDRLKIDHVPYPNKTRVFLSGEKEVFTYQKRTAEESLESNIMVLVAKQEIFANLKRYFSILIDVGFNATVSPVLLEDNNRLTAVILGSNFALLGDLNSSPFYFTFGQVFVPFGQYTSYNPVLDPLNKVIFRTNGAEIAASYYNDTVLLSAYVFKGFFQKQENDVVNNYGVNFEYIYSNKYLNWKSGVSWIRDINDSITEGLTFPHPARIFRLDKLIPGLDIRTNLSIGKFHFIAEYNTALSAFSSEDYTFNGHGAKVAAYDVEVAYDFLFYKLPTAVSLGYSESFEALAYQVPKKRIELSFATNPTNNTILSIFLNWDVLYPAGTTASLPKGRIPDGYYVNPQLLGKKDFTFGVDFQSYY